MTIFDLIFLAALLISVITLASAAVCALRGRGKRSLKILRNYGLGVVVYFLVALAVDFFHPQRVIAIDAPFCLDDWCLQVWRAASRNAPRVHGSTLLTSTAGGIPLMRIHPPSPWMLNLAPNSR